MLAHPTETSRLNQCLTFIEDAYTYGVARDQETKTQAVELHRRRYAELGYLNDQSFDPYEEKSVYFAAVDKESQNVVGVNRLVFDELDELPTLKHFDISHDLRRRFRQLPSGSYAEMGAFTKDRGHSVTLGILKSAFRNSLNSGVRYWFCCLDSRVYRLLEKLLGVTFDVIGATKYYQGPETIPCYIDLVAIAESLHGHVNEYFYCDTNLIEESI